MRRSSAEDYDKVPEVWRDASPVDHVAKSDAPFLIVHGTQDECSAVAQAQELYEKLHQAGVKVTFVKLDSGHTIDIARSASPVGCGNPDLLQPLFDG